MSETIGSLVESQAVNVMLISIIVPTRNRVPLLTRALQAIKSQDYENYEVLVIDDGSNSQTRATYPTLRTELGDKFHFVSVGMDNQRGQGPSASRNLGIQMAQGDVLAFCDDDDLWVDPSHLAAIVKLFEKHASVDLCISNQRAVFTNGSVREHWLPNLSSRALGLPILDERFCTVTLRDLCNSGGFAHMNMCCVRRNVIQATGGFWEAVNYEEDRDFFWRCVDNCAELAYTTTTVAQHHVPDPAQRINVSTAIQQQGRWLVASMVNRHIAVSVHSQAIVQLCLRYEGDLLRHLSLHCTSHNQAMAGWLFARQALGARFSVKWAAYCVLAWIRSYKKS